MFSLRNAGFRVKLSTLPAVAAAGYLVTLLVVVQLGVHEQRLIVRARTVDYPALESSYDLARTSSALHSDLQAAVSAGDSSAVDDTESLSKHFLAALDGDAGQQQLATSFRKYYEGASAVSRRMIRRDTDPGVIAAMQESERAYEALQAS